jgi:hypothetical protein
MLDSIFDIKLLQGLSNLPFGATMADVEAVFGKAEQVELWDELEVCQATVWHYWSEGFSLFFEESEAETFCDVEIDNEEVLLWGSKVMDLKEEQIIELFKKNDIVLFETEEHEWGEKRLSFNEMNIDFYFEKNKLVTINFGK